MKMHLEESIKAVHTVDVNEKFLLILLPSNNRLY